VHVLNDNKSKALPTINRHMPQTNIVIKFLTFLCFTVKKFGLFIIISVATFVQDLTRQFWQLVASEKASSQQALLVIR